MRVCHGFFRTIHVCRRISDGRYMNYKTIMCSNTLVALKSDVLHYWGDAGNSTTFTHDWVLGNLAECALRVERKACAGWIVRSRNTLLRLRLNAIWACRLKAKGGSIPWWQQRQYSNTWVNLLAKVGWILSKSAQDSPPMMSLAKHGGGDKCRLRASNIITLYTFIEIEQ